MTHPFQPTEFTPRSTDHCKTVEDFMVWRIEERARLDAWHELEIQAIDAWADHAKRKGRAWFWSWLGGLHIVLRALSFAIALSGINAVSSAMTIVYFTIAFTCLYRYDQIDESYHDPRT